jgi:catechol 2,3-dioxygenase
VHLRVSDLDRATAFYRDVLGFSVVADGRPAGLQAVFLAAGDYHHHIALNSWSSEAGTPPPEGHTGLHHLAILYPHRDALGDAVRRLSAQGYRIDDARDHGCSVAVYLRDPDCNGLELYYDRPRAEWYDLSGRPILKNEPFDSDELLIQRYAA